MQRVTCRKKTKVIERWYYHYHLA